MNYKGSSSELPFLFLIGVTIMIIDDYINSFESVSVRERLSQLRKLVFETVPEAIEAFAYGLPSYKYKKKPLVYFGAFTKHIGLYATPSSNENFQKELTKYKQGRGSIQFPHDKELPLDLIMKIILFKKNEIDTKL